MQQDKNFEGGLISKKITREILGTKFSKSKRSSIIPFFLKNGTKYYFLAISAEYDQVNDMGGRIDPGEDFLESAIRELNEESVCVFDYKDNYNYIADNSITIYDDNNIITFVNISYKSDLCEDFEENYKLALKDLNTDPVYLENRHMIYISEEDLKNLCKNEKVKMPKKLSKIIGEFKYYPNIYLDLKNTLIKGFRGWESLDTLH